MLGVYRWLPDEQMGLLVEMEEAELMSQIARIWALAIVISFGLIGVSSVIARSLTNWLVTPLEKIVAVTQTLQAGDLSKRAPPGGHDEIGQLSRAINEMAESLQHSYEGLEQLVQQRTSELAEANEQLKIENTERKEIEEELREINRRLEETLEDLKAAQQQIVQQERLAAVGQLAAGIAHDFNNTLLPITLYVDLLNKEPKLTKRGRERLGTIKQQAIRAASLTQQILDFSRRAVMKVQVLDMGLFLDEFRELITRTLPESVHVEFEHGSDEYVVSADPARMQQVLMNLALNAHQAMRSDGQLRFELKRIRFGREQEPPFAGMARGAWVQVDIIDTGEGILPEHLPHIFEPFYTTKQAGEGSGLGLAQVYGIIKQHEGYIDVKSQVGVGTTFTLYLPAITWLKVTESDAQEGVSLEGNQECILLVEDDEITRSAVRDTLEFMNYKVLTADSGREALEVFEQHEVDLVLSDMIMPEMGGVALYEALSEKDPAVKMVLITGYPLGDEGRELLQEGILAWIQKPVSTEVVARTIREALSGGLVK